MKVSYTWMAMLMLVLAFGAENWFLHARIDALQDTSIRQARAIKSLADTMIQLSQACEENSDSITKLAKALR